MGYSCSQKRLQIKSVRGSTGDNLPYDPSTNLTPENTRLLPKQNVGLLNTGRTGIEEGVRNETPNVLSPSFFSVMGIVVTDD